MTHHRVICDLRYVAPATSPFGGPTRARGTKALGHKFEREVGKQLVRQGYAPLCGQWFRFRDVNGWGYCQTDVLLDLGHAVAVLECKLTDTDAARSQLLRLYRPIIEKAFERPALLITVTRHLTRETNTGLIVTALSEALKHPGARSGMPPTLHWLGKGPI